MAYETITISQERSIATLTLNRPASLNAITRQMVRELIAAFDAIEHDESVRALILTGAGRAFSAGFDLNEIMLNPASTLEQRKRLTENEKLMQRGLWELSKPVVARVHGAAVGGGLHLCLLADFVVASDSSRFGEPEILFGGGTAVALAWHLGYRKAKEMLMLGEIIGAQQALEYQLINRVVPLAELDQSVAELAARLAKLSPLAISQQKQSFRKAYEVQGYWDSFDYSHELFNLGRMAPDPAREEFRRRVETEGIKAALAWREAQRRAADEG
jgi:enoyl-CoA hydratase/carnithine racemase